MKDAAIIEKHGIERIGKRELTQRSTIGIKDLRHAARHIGSLDQHHAYPIDAVPMCPSGVGIPVPLGVASMRN